MITSLFKRLRSAVQSQVIPTEWKHGWETRYVKATRYTNPYMGFNIGFTLPEHPNDCDRKEMFDWLSSQGVHSYQSGGYPGAEILAMVDGVRTVDQANEWLPEFLPRFHTWIATNLRRL